MTFMIICCWGLVCWFGLRPWIWRCWMKPVIPTMTISNK